MLYICSLPNSGTAGHPKELFTDDATLAERFAQAEDREGRGVYECLNPLVPGARRRSLETVAELRWIYFDLDLQNINTSRDEVLRRLQQLPFEFTWVRDSGSGNLHVAIEIKDPPPRDTPEYDRAVAVWKRLVEKLAADPAPAHPAALIRRLGTRNRKNDNNGLCEQLWNGGVPQDITELEAFDELLAAPLFTYKAKPVFNAHAANDTGFDEPWVKVDVEALLTSLQPSGGAVNEVQSRVIPALIWRAMNPNDVVDYVVDATMAMAERHGLCWSRDVEVAEVRTRLNSTLRNLFLAKYDHTTGAVPVWLCGDFHGRWVDALAEGRRPDIGLNPGGFYVRSWGPSLTATAAAAVTATAEREQNPNRKNQRAGGVCWSLAVQALRRYNAATPLLALRQTLPAPHRVTDGRARRHGQNHHGHGRGRGDGDRAQPARRATGGAAAHLVSQRRRPARRNLSPAGGHLPALRNPARGITGSLWMTSGNEFPLRVANGYTNLEIDAGLVQQISAAIADNQIDLAMFDPFVTLHSVSEVDTGKMDAVVRLFAGIADDNDAAIEIAHHVRKPAAGSSADYDVHDIRGVGAITDAVRAARVLNRMNEKDADAAGCSEVERLSRFRVDRAKGNYSAAAGRDLAAIRQRRAAQRRRRWRGGAVEFPRAGRADTGESGRRPEGGARIPATARQVQCARHQR